MIEVYALVLQKKQTEKSDRLVFSVFVGSMRITKTGLVSGKKTQSDEKDINRLMEICCKQNPVRIEKHLIAIDIEKMVELTQLENCVICYELNHRLLSINNVEQLGIESLSLENNNLFAVTRTEVIRVTEKTTIITCAEKTLFLGKEKAFVVNAPLNKRLLKKTILSKRPTIQVTKEELFGIVKKDRPNKVCVNVDVVVDLEYTDNKWLIRPSVLYNGVPVRPSDESNVIIDGENYYRDYSLEKKVKDNTGLLVKIDDNCYTNKTESIYAVITRMITDGFKVHYQKKPVVISHNAFDDIRIKTGIDWFELTGNVCFCNESIRISEAIRHTSGAFVEASDAVLLLPENMQRVIEQADESGKVALTIQNYNRIIESNIDKENQNMFERVFDTNKTVSLRIPDAINSKLYSYQKQGVQWMKSRVMQGFGVCLADDMGLGKTIQLITLIRDVDIQTTRKKVLIIVPTVVVGNWLREFELFGGSEDVTVYYGPSRKMDDDATILLTSYGIALADKELIQKQKWDLIILDEAQRVKNLNAKTRKAIKELSKNSVVIASTGTPYENNLLELWSILDLVNPSILGSSKSFEQNYLMNPNEEKTIELSHKVAPFILKRDKKDVLSDLPDKTIKNIYCIMDRKQRKLYDAMLLRIRKDLQTLKDDNEKLMTALSGLTYLREICCDPRLINQEDYVDCNSSTKSDVVTSIVEEALEEGKKIVIFSQFTRFLKIIANNLDEQNIKYCYIDGKTAEKEVEISKFNNQDYPVMLVSLRAAGVGINLTSANTMVICDPWWNPAVERQAEDRLYRIGQSQNVTVYKLIVRDSVEEKMLELKERKEKIGETVFESVMESNKLDLKTALDILS